jgi:nucleoside-diphosphate-sugar epimerase
VRVLVAGATGAVGRPLVPRLLAAGHEVVGLTRSPERADGLRAQGAEAIVCDVLEAGAAQAAARAAAPEAIVDMLTDLPPVYDVRKLGEAYAVNARVKRIGCRGLLAAGRELGTRRHVSQSVAFLYRPEGARLKTEDDPVMSDARPPFGANVALQAELDAEVVAAGGTVLRFGFFYGPGTWYAPDGSMARDVRRRRLPVVGSGRGLYPFIHVDDAADAVVAAVERGVPGIFHVADDDPAPMREWVPAFAAALGAPKPFRVPAWLVRLVAGPQIAAMGTDLRGVSTERARRELGWAPAHPSWREGFRSAV